MSKKPAKTYPIYLIYSETQSGGEPTSEGVWACRKPQYTEFYPEKLVLELQDFQETIDVSWRPELGQKTWLVVVRYQTGSTFGTCHGRWKIINLYSDSEPAIEVAKAIKKYPEDRNELQQALISCDVDLSIRLSPCWMGYFERLEDVEIHEMMIEKDSEIKIIKH